MIVPHARAELKKYTIGSKTIASAKTLVAVLGMCGMLLPYLAVRTLHHLRRVQGLERQNAGLRQANAGFDASLAELKDELTEFENKSYKFALIAGVEDLLGANGGAGGSESTGTAASVPSADYLRQQVTQLRQRTQALRASYSVLEKVYEDQSLLLASTPSILPVNGILGHGFGWRRDPFTDQREFHNGIDISAPTGRNVMAPADGIVVKASRVQGYGRVIYLSHGNGITTRYGHMSEFEVKLGQKVKRGDVIGFVGSTGRSTGPHLHYEVLVHNQTVDPMQYILESLPSI
jgi:murein DD-endopeptidase MepM/ murein hydrolase activator NlpD